MSTYEEKITGLVLRSLIPVTLNFKAQEHIWRKSNRISAQANSCNANSMSKNRQANL